MSRCDCAGADLSHHDNTFIAVELAVVRVVLIFLFLLECSDSGLEYASVLSPVVTVTDLRLTELYRCRVL